MDKFNTLKNKIRTKNHSTGIQNKVKINGNRIKKK